MTFRIRDGEIVVADSGVDWGANGDLVEDKISPNRGNVVRAESYLGDEICGIGRRHSFKPEVLERVEEESLTWDCPVQIVSQI